MNKKIQLFNISKEATIFFKGLAIILVILGHMGYIYLAGAWGVCLFLILSGYGIDLSYIKNNNKDYFKKKINKIYLPYLLVTIILIIYYIFTSGFHFSKKIILFSFLGVDFGLLYDKTMWYISFIFIEYIIFYFSCIVSKIIFKNKNNILIVILNIIFSFLLYFLLKKYSIFNSGGGAFCYVFSFPIGVLMSWLSKIYVSKQSRNNIYKAFCCLCLVSLFYLYNNVVSDLQFIIFANVLPIMIVLLYELKIIKINNKYINWFGINSFDIYLWEGFILNNRIFWFGALNNKYLIDTITFIIIITTSYYYRKKIINPVLALFLKNNKILKD